MTVFFWLFAHREYNSNVHYFFTVWTMAMIKNLTQHSPMLTLLKRFLFGLILLLCGFVATFRFLHADSLPFEDDLTTIFPWIDTGNYTNTYFKFGGNDFVGIIFWQDQETLSTPQTISINSWSQAISCTEKLRWIYYNNQRGRVIWPLDTGNLAELQSSSLAVGYDDMSMQHGFYTNCSPLSGGYIPAANEVYGQIDHTLSGVGQFHLFAGVDYDFTGNAIINSSPFAHTLSIISWLHNGYIFDDNGGIAELSMNLPYCTSFDVSSYFYEGTTGSFICQANNIAGYGLDIISGGTQVVYSTTTMSTGSQQRWMTWSALPAGNYTAICTILYSWSGGTPCGGEQSFQVLASGGTIPSGTWCDPNFQGEITFLPSSPDQFITNPSLGTYFTNKTGIILQRAATTPNQTTISGDLSPQIVPSSWFLNYTGNDIFTDIASYPVSLTKTNDWNYFFSSYAITGSSGNCTYTDAAKRIFMDTLPPTSPTITAPTSWSYACPSAPMTLTRTASTDSGSQLSHYAYEIYSNTGLTNIVLSGTVPNTITTTQLTISSLPIGTYYMRVAAIDNVGLIAYSNTIVFTTAPSYCPAGTGIMIVSPIISITNADLDTVYRSDPIYIFGLTGPTLLIISKWMLFINNGTGVWTTGIVTSNDTIHIELISSNEHDTTISSQLTILNKTGTFSVTTKDSDCVLSASERLVIQNIYAELKDEYNNDISKYSEFLTTFQSMVEDESNLSNSCTLEYLLQLIEDDFGSEWIDTKDHITPNCKEYTIGYDVTEWAYYSPDMMNRYYFINRESLIRHLDYYNPGDCHINTYGTNYRSSSENPILHIAPNGKIYHLIGQYGGYSAEEFISPKYFDSLQGIKTYIDLRNPAKDIWKHTLDTAFIPIVYAAPNGKEYKIYKTDRGFMSYKLMKVRYFSSLWELKSYIDKNNPSKR